MTPKVLPLNIDLTPFRRRKAAESSGLVRTNFTLPHSIPHLSAIVQALFRRYFGESETSQSSVIVAWDDQHHDAELVLAFDLEHQTGTLIYDPSKLDPDAIERIPGHLVALIEASLREPSRSLDELPILTAAEQSQIQSWNATSHELGASFLERIERRTDGIAVAFNDVEITYRELNERANRLAVYLVQQGIGPDDAVAIALERSPELCVALLSVLKSGGVYVPVDPNYPTDRIAFMLADSGAKVLLTQRSLKDRLPHTQVICLDEPIPECEPVQRRSSSDDLGYIIYTSGSTGQPKGVAMRRGALDNLIDWQCRTSTAGPGDRTIQFTSLSFDVSFQEIISTWASGGRLELVTEETRRDPIALVRLLDEREIARLFLPFVMLQYLAEASNETGIRPQKLREVITAGEQLLITPAVAEFFTAMPNCTLHNHYGPSETHVVTAWTMIGPPSEWPALPPIGTPITNTRIYLVDEHLQPVPIGVSGELLAAGECLARGYIHRDQLTAERFIVANILGREERLYRTGDLARYQNDGVIEFLGRRDQQVKIRGFRVEPGEVEVMLNRLPGVKEAIVVVREDSPGEKRLIAYHLPGPTTEELRAGLKERLPEYMIPAAFVEVERFPLTPSGKVDRRQLPAPPERAIVPFHDETERIIAEVWADVLKVSALGRDDNFFEVGGHSLAAVRVHTKLRQRLSREFPLVVLFQRPTIRGLAEFLSNESPTIAHIAQPRQVVSDSVAIVGMAGRFPGADDINAFWQNLANGVESVSFFTDAELLASGIEPELLRRSDYVRARAILNEPAMFDASFFGYTPREAELIDPQQRLFLETCWTALEHAGYDPARFPGAIGVYAGASLDTYLLANIFSKPEARDELVKTFQVGGYATLLGNDKDYLATRVSYKLNLRGPSMTIQTACSTSLVAVCQAFESLVSGQCDMALAGGVSVSFPQRRGYLYQEGNIASADGHCRTFDASATGTVFGEGVGVVVLKRLSDAIADRDTIHAVIKGVGLNNDGSGKVSYMAPSVDGQAEAVRKAQIRANVDPRQISYVEAHGTGTPIGDPIELASLTKAFRETTTDSGFCAIGSVKSNIGHLESAAGVTGLIKTVLALEHRQLPPSLHYRTPNPAIDFANSPFVVNATLREWISDISRIAAVNSLGVGGTNAHVIVEEAPASEPSSTNVPQVLLFSARSANAADQQSINLRSHLDGHSLADVAHTLQVGRHRFDERRFVVATDRDDATNALNDPKRIVRGTPIASNRDIAFLFPGQGSQYVQMAMQLYHGNQFFHDRVNECVAILEPLLNLDLRTILFPTDYHPQGTNGTGYRATDLEAQLNQTSITQPSLFVIEYSLARLWMDWGITPSAMIGHSVGEYTAAVLAGVFSLEDGLTLLTKRAKFIQSLDAGSMLAVRVEEREIAPLLNAHRSLAAVNGASQCVVSGTREAVAELEQVLTERKIASRILATSHAFHSSMMDPILATFTDEVSKVARHAPTIPFISSVTGTWITTEQATSPQYWADHLRQTVRFASGLKSLRESKPGVLLEVGPGRTLAGLAQQSIAKGSDERIIASLPERGTDQISILNAVGKLWIAGLELDWSRIHESEPRRRVPLPTYPFERQRYFIEPMKSGSVDHHQNGQVVVEIAPTVDRSSQLVAKIQHLFADLSGTDAGRLDPATTFLELGFDSLFLTQAVLAIQNKLGVRVTFRQLLEEFSTIDALAKHVEKLTPPEPAPLVVSRAPTIAPSGDLQSLITQQMALMQQQMEMLQKLTGQSITPVVKSPPPITTAPAAFGPFRPIDQSSDELSPTQKQFLDELIVRYTRRTNGSKKHTQEHRFHHADPRTVSGFTRLWKEMVYPIVVNRSLGSKLWDIDGNEYIDLLNGFGPVLLGHSPSFVVEAVEKQLKAGYEVGPQSPLAGVVAKLIAELTGNDRVSFVCTGSEAVYGAMRAARTATGRDKIVLFARDYHGNFDEVLVRAANTSDGLRSFPSAPGIARSAVENVIVLDYGTPESLEIIRQRANELAAVLVEPVQSRRPELQPREFLHEIRRITEQSGTCLIFDEVITGFRIHQGGAQAYFGVKADLCTYGKIVAGGMPIGVVAGKSAFMDVFDGGMWEYGDDSIPEAGRTFFAGTFVRHPIALSAAQATLSHLKHAGPSLQESLNRRADLFVQRLDGLCSQYKVPVKVVNCGSLLYFRMSEGSKAASLLFYCLRERGIYILEGFPSYLTTAHSDADLDTIIRRFEESAISLAKGGFLEVSEAFASKEIIPTVGPFAPLPQEIPVAGAIESFPLTEAQTELWLAAQMEQDASTGYNESCSLELRGPLDVVAMRKAVSQLVERHPALRTVYNSTEPVQYVLASIDVDVPLLDLSSTDDQPSSIARILDEESQTPFDLATGPILRVKLIRRSDNDHLLSLTVHHIACDGWAYDILLHELGALYSANVTGELAKLAPVKPFSEYATEQRQWSETSYAKTVEAFWLKQFASPPPPLDLPTDRPRPNRRTHHGRRSTFVLGEALTARVRSGAKKLGSTPYQVLFTAFQCLLYRLTGQNELTIGIPSAGQALIGSRTLVGHCVHFLPIRVHVDDNATFAALTQQTKKLLLDVFDHQPFTYVTLIRKLNLARDHSRAPLVSATFNLDPAITDLEFRGLTWRILKNPRYHVIFDLHFNLVDTGNDLELECEYNSDLFDATTIERWADMYSRLVDHLLAQPAVPCEEVALISAEERHRVVVEWNPAPTPYHAEWCVHEAFEQQVKATPDAIALLFGDERATYAELNATANRIAHKLRLMGVSPGEPVAICMERSITSIAAMIGILKAGGAYLPLDAGYPTDRLAFMAKDADAKILIADSPHDLPLAQWIPNRDALGDLDACDLTNVNQPDSLAYIIYTSGSTGTPKGVTIPHRAVMRLVFGTNFVKLTPESVVGHIASVSFDATTFEVWGPLLTGGKCALFDGGPPGVAELGAFLRRHRVDTLFVTSGLFNTVIDVDASTFETVRQLSAGGEALSASHVRRALELLPSVELGNGYGPTETTTFATWYTVPRPFPDGMTNVPIGRPIANTFVLVLDRDRRPVPIGVVGELYIGGPGTAHGYLNRESLTAERFLDSPIPEFAGHRFYRTGDLVRWLPNGVLEYQGRNDDQVKVRGFRIELGEVENALAKHPKIVRAVAAVQRISSASVDLIGYYVSKSGTRITSDELREFMQSRMPKYMVPTQFVALEQVPLTRNGKVDRAALPVPKPSESERIIIGARDPIEQALVGIWSRVLHTSRISVTDDFFDLGGHSLKAAELIALVQKDLGHALPLGTLFAAPSIEKMARVICERIETHSDSPLVPFVRCGTKAPLFLVSGVGGHVFTFHQFSRQLGVDHPIYGLKAIGIDGGIGPVDTIEEMAKLYVTAILEERPQGPYILGGYSAGGMVALETALQLQEAGHSVPMLLIFDGASPGYGLLPFWKRMGVHLTAVLRPRGVSRWKYIRQRVQNIRHRLLWKMGLGGWIAKTLTGEGLIPDDTLKRVRLAALNASKTYHPTLSFKGKIVLFKAEVLEDWDMMTVDDPLLGWSRWHSGAMETHSFPVGHLELFTEPNVHRIADVVRDVLDRM